MLELDVGEVGQEGEGVGDAAIDVGVVSVCKGVYEGVVVDVAGDVGVKDVVVIIAKSPDECEKLLGVDVELEFVLLERAGKVTDDAWVSC